MSTVPSSEFKVHTQQFSGPLDKLLELIEEKKLEVTTVSMADVTADFLKYVKTIGGDIHPAILSDFLVVAAKLVLIKSKTLLPMLELTEEEEADIKDLEGRLKIYREFALRGSEGSTSASQYVQKFWGKNKIAYGRPLLMSLGDSAVFYPPPKLQISDLQKSIHSLTKTLQVLLPETQKIRKTVVSIEQKMEELLNRFQEAGQQSFQKIAGKSKEEAIVLFLAVLHLVKDKMIKVRQEDRFSDIILENSKSQNPNDK